MKKIYTTAAAALLLFLAACGNNDPVIKVGASAIPHAEILEFVQPVLKKQGYKLEIVTFQDYVLPNKALASKDLDANYFQHVVYLEAQIKEHAYDFINAGNIHIEPMGMYSKSVTDLKDLKQGATIIFSNSVGDRGRVLALLQSSGLISLQTGIATVDLDFRHVRSNPKALVLKNNVDPALLASVYNNQEGDIVIINTNYALEAGLSPAADALAIETSSSPYSNVVAVRAEDKDSEKIKLLVAALQSPEAVEFIKTKYKGAVVPVK